MRVLLLNPPGSRAWIRDGYCSLEGRRSYRFHPLDLLVQAGALQGLADVRVLDAIGLGLTPDEALRRAQAASPEVVLCLVGSASLHEDAAFLRQLRDRLPRVRLVASGDVVQYDPEVGFRALPMLDAALLDFTVPVVDGAQQVGPGRVRPPALRGTFRYGVPPYEAFPWAQYALPYRPGRIGSPLASFGCPYGCTFCNTSQVAYKRRDPDDLGRELAWLAGRGVRHAYVRDATFGIGTEHQAAVLDVLRRSGLTWNTFTRVDLLDPDTLRGWHAAGCRVLQLGLEVADAERMKSLAKPLDRGAVRATVQAARSAGVAVCGHFLLGVPGETAADRETTVRYALWLGLDYASFNVVEARPGAPFARTGTWTAAPGLTAERDRAMRRFYLHPATWGRLLARLRGPGEALWVARQAAAVLSG